jgi:hypothetical protein
MSKIRMHTYHSYTVEIDGTEYPVSAVGENVQHRWLEDGKLLRVGYLTRDEMCEDPLESCDGSGKIGTCGRRDSKEYNERYRQARENPDPLNVWLDIYEHSGRHYSISGSQEAAMLPDREWDVAGCAGVWIPDDACREHIESAAVASLLPEGVKVEYKSKYNPDGTCITRPPKEGEKPYFQDGTCIDERYSNVITLTMPDGKVLAPYKSFRSAYCSAARRLGIHLSKPLLAAAAVREARRCATSAIEEHNSWLAGDCWNVHVDEICKDTDGEWEIIEDDCCGGYVGGKWAEQELKDRMEAK